MKTKSWFLFALITTIFWGVWGAFSELPEKEGFPGTLIYVSWSVTMIIPAFFSLKSIKWKIEHDKKSILYGLTIGFLGAGGQLALLVGAIVNGPAYLIFPIISLSPIITIFLSLLFLKEKADKRAWLGIVLALIAIPLLSYQDPENTSKGYLWFIFALSVFLVWGLQAFFMKTANNFMKSESIFFYMTLTGLLLSPIALFMTDFSGEINYGFSGLYSSFLIQILNSVGALTIVYAFRYGKAMIVSPMTNAVAPVVTVVLSLIIYSVIPGKIVIAGMILAIISAFLLAKEKNETD